MRSRKYTFSWCRSFPGPIQMCPDCRSRWFSFYTSRIGDKTKFQIRYWYYLKNDLYSTWKVRCQGNLLRAVLGDHLINSRWIFKSKTKTVTLPVITTDENFRTRLERRSPGHIIKVTVNTSNLVEEQNLLPNCVSIITMDCYLCICVYYLPTPKMH